MAAAVLVAWVAHAVLAAVSHQEPVAVEQPQFETRAAKLALVTRIEEGWKKVRRWLLEYDARPQPTVPGLAGAHRTMAVAAPGELYHMGAHYAPGLAWQEDPFCQEYFVHSNITCHRWLFNRTYTPTPLRKSALISGSIPHEPLLAIIPSWPLTDYRLDGGLAWGGCITPPEALRSQAYRLLARRETVGGRMCAVFDRNGTDRIWVAWRLGLCIMKRERRAVVSHRLLYRVVARKVAQVGPGLWFPTEFRYQLFSQTGPADPQSLEADYDVHILRCELGKAVPDSTFIAPMPPGSLEFRPDGTFVQTVPGGQDLLEKIATFAAKNATHTPWFSLTGGAGWPYVRPGLALGAGFCVGLFFVRIRKRQANALDAEPAKGAGQGVRQETT
ncbi:MAG: hypothetical protein M1541_16350 [Acidobacteria bacterium]|nr:hypothetical protein [Acidobacteriota bacterium]